MTEGERRVRWNVYAMNLGGGIVDTVGFLLIDTIEEKDVRLSNHDRLDCWTHRVDSGLRGS